MAQPSAPLLRSSLSRSPLSPPLYHLALLPNTVRDHRLEAVHIRAEAAQADLLDLASVNQVWVGVAPCRGDGRVRRVVGVC